MHTISKLLLLTLFIASFATAKDKIKEEDKNACSQPSPASLCNAGNTCGSASAPCSVDVKRTAASSAVVPGIANTKGNGLFCVKTGTTVKWHAAAKNTGFNVDLGAASPFDPPGVITGGTDKAVSVVAKTPGCFKYTFTASDSSATYGISKESHAELIVIGAQ